MYLYFYELLCVYLLSNSIVKTIEKSMHDKRMHIPARENVNLKGVC